MISTLANKRIKQGDRVVVATAKAEAEVIDASDPAKLKVKLDGRECWVGRKAILYVYQTGRKNQLMSRRHNS